MSEANISNNPMNYHNIPYNLTSKPSNPYNYMKQANSSMTKANSPQ